VALDHREDLFETVYGNCHDICKARIENDVKSYQADEPIKTTTA